MAEVIVDEAATEDYRRSARWFEERQLGKGREFAHMVRAQLTQISLHPKLGPFLTRYDCRRLLISGFKHDIFYELDGEAVNVRAILDLRRDPRDIARLLTERLPGP